MIFLKPLGVKEVASSYHLLEIPENVHGHQHAARVGFD
jgi:hypothetical protein